MAERRGRTPREIVAVVARHSGHALTRLAATSTHQMAAWVELAFVAVLAAVLHCKKDGGGRQDDLRTVPTAI